MMEIVELPSEQPDAIDPFDPIKRLQRGDEASAGPSDASQLITPQTGCASLRFDSSAFLAIMLFWAAPLTFAQRTAHQLRHQDVG